MPESSIKIEGITPSSGAWPVTQFAPSTFRFFGFYLPDSAGVVAANNFVSQFNPVGSGVNVVGYFLGVSCHSANASAATSSMIAQRISAASGGTLVTASTINKFDPSQSNSVMQIRTGNPTVTRTGLELVGFPPVMSGGTGNNAASIVAPSGASFISPPGTGIVVGTATGDVDQLWGINMIWAEVPIT